MQHTITQSVFLFALCFTTGLAGRFKETIRYVETSYWSPADRALTSCSLKQGGKTQWLPLPVAEGEKVREIRLTSSSALVLLDNNKLLLASSSQQRPVKTMADVKEVRADYRSSSFAVRSSEGTIEVERPGSVSPVTRTGSELTDWDYDPATGRVALLDTQGVRIVHSGKTRSWHIVSPYMLQKVVFAGRSGEVWVQGDMPFLKRSCMLSFNKQGQYEGISLQQKRLLNGPVTADPITAQRLLTVLPFLPCADSRQLCP